MGSRYFTQWGAIEECEFNGRRYVFWPLLSDDGEVLADKGLIIVMATHNNGDRYFAIDALRKHKSASLLFVTDPDNSYYLGANGRCSYEELFDHCISLFDPKNVTFFGSSMAGYGALLHGVRLNCNVIASNPQINFEVTKEYCWPALRNTISRLKECINLDDWMPDNYRDSAIHLIHGRNVLDVENIKCLIKADIRNRWMSISSVDDDRHGFYINDFESVFQLHECLCAFRRISRFSPNERALAKIARDGALNT
ncbi:hypothetical protein SGO26_12280 [Cupriavidus metallidurans]|uniref:hypothetical protein n=1 Tax=Cupriavidus TaxID=106589 RepID=UPI001267805B|nr:MULTISPECIES: hypothetical protein [unclassified Cupriavidus]GMG90921.1 hypothetical protein Cmtc_21410 [Cupriavidus sp. TKC]